MDMFDDFKPAAQQPAAGGDPMAFLSENQNTESPAPAANGGAMMFMEPAKNDTIELTDNNNNADAFGSMPAPTKNADFAPASESQALRAWQQQMDAEIEKKAAQELEDKKKKRATAQKELADFYAERKASIEKKRQTNRREEAEMQKLLASSGDTGGNPWEKVCAMIDTKSVAVKGEEVTVDTSRFKSLLIGLKSETVKN